MISPVVKPSHPLCSVTSSWIINYRPLNTDERAKRYEACCQLCPRGKIINNEELKNDPVISDIVEYIIMEWTMPNESRKCRICRRVLILKKKQKSVAGQFAAVKYRSETYCWTQKLNREDYGLLGTTLPCSL
eukprot:06562_1